MRPTDNIEKLVKKLRYKASAGAHSRVLDNILLALENRQQPAVTQPNIWRIILRSPITKLAAAAAIIVMALLGIFEFRFSRDGGAAVAGIAWARAEEALKEVSCVHIIRSARWKDEKVYTKEEWWRDNESRISIIKHNKTVIFKDFGRGVEYQYNPKNNEIIVSSVTGNFQQYPLHWKWKEYVQEISNRYANLDISHRQEVLDGENVKVFKWSGLEKNKVRRESEIYVDAERELPLIFHSKRQASDGSVLFESTSVYEYPEDGPKTMYDVGVPKSAKVYDYCSMDLEVPDIKQPGVRESARKLSALRKALFRYSYDHDEQYPDTLRDLEDYLKETCDGSLEDFQWFIENVEYLGKGKKSSTPAWQPYTLSASIALDKSKTIAYDKSMIRRGKGTNVMYIHLIAFEKPSKLAKLGIFYYREQARTDCID